MTFDRRCDPNPRERGASELEALRTRLCRGDPAADGSEPSGHEIRVLRERVTRAAAHDRPARSLWSRRPAMAAALLILALGAALIAGLARWPSGGDGSRSAETAGIDRPAREAPHGSASATATDPRQIHFTTPGGTRIVWVLYRNAEAHPSAGDPGGFDDTRGTT